MPINNNTKRFLATMFVLAFRKHIPYKLPSNLKFVDLMDALALAKELNKQVGEAK